MSHPFTSPSVHPLFKHRRAAQRSVDSLPLSTYATTAAYPPTPATAPIYDTQFLNPDYTWQHSNHGSPSTVCDEPVGESFTPPLNNVFLEKTMSPHNPKRASMNDFSMLAYSGVGEMQGIHHQHSLSAGLAISEYAHSNASTEQFYNPTLAQHQAIGSTDFTFPPLSRSSSGTVSEQGDFFTGEELSTNGAIRPNISVDPSWTFPAQNDKSFFNFTPSSYQGTPLDHRFSTGESSATDFAIDSTVAGFNPFTGVSRAEGLGAFGITMADLNDTATAQDPTMHILPDKSTQFYGADAEPILNMEFRFPGPDLGPHDGFQPQHEQSDWSQDMSDSMLRVDATGGF